MKRSMKPLTQLATRSLDLPRCNFLCFAPFVFLRPFVSLTPRMSPESFGSLVSGRSVALLLLKEKATTETIEAKLVSSDKIVQT